MKKNHHIIALLSCSSLFAQTKISDSVKVDTLAMQPLEEVVVSASRIKESILKSPVT